ncbi:MAG: sensor histidine kinase [Pirellulales bacterium]
MIYRLGVIVSLLLAYAALAGHAQASPRPDMAYTHLAYVPIALAAMWWGRKGVIVAVVLAGIVAGFRLAGMGGGQLWSDLERMFFFVAVALSIGVLREKVVAGREALRISEEQYRLLTEKSLSGISVYRDEIVLFANSRLSEMLGYPPDAMVGLSIWKLFHEEDRPRVRELVSKRKEEGLADLHYECRLVRQDGTIVWAEVASTVATYEGTPAVLVNAYDITDRKEAEQKRREFSELARKQEEQLVHSTRLAELGEMAAAVAHELNQPLTGIRNFARNAFYMLENDAGSSDEVKENLRLISQQVDRASKIINQMRELARRAEMQLGLVDLNGTVAEAVEFLRPQLRLSEVEIDLALAENLPQVQGDRLRLEQVFLNLLTNARHAMEAAPVRRLTVKTYLEAHGPCPAIVEIADTGHGFEPADAEKLFTPFFSTKKAGHGTGLGLSISLSIIKEHQGTIEAIGMPGRGARFLVRLPLAEPEKA